MRNIKYIFVSIFILLTICLLPICVNAKSYYSSFVELRSHVKFDSDLFELEVKYENSHNQFDDLVIKGTAINKTDEVYYYHYVIYLINSKKETVEITSGYNKIMEKGSILNENNFLVLLEDVNLFATKYYRLFIEPSTKEHVDAYLSTYTKNTYGTEKIEDNDIKYLYTSYQEIYSSDKNNILPENNGNGTYALADYKMNIVVNENNTFNIEEKITAYFFVDQHGIYRKIPLKNELVRLDGTKSTNYAKISSIVVNNKYTSNFESGYKVLKIGDPKKTLTGSKEYVIKYLYDIGKDPNKDYDELYFNIVGSEWDTSLSNVEFVITMPKEFDKTKLGFASGAVGSTDSSKIEYNVTGNIISGKYNEVLNPGEAVTVRLELPEGYFVRKKNNLNPMIIILFTLPIVFALIAFILWSLYGKDKKTIDPIEFYPPEGFNSAQIGFLYKGKADINDIVSLLIYLADKGFIKIEESENKSLLSLGKGFKIIKLKEFKGRNREEQIFFNGLFKKNKTEVTSDDLKNNFYKTTNRILAIFNEKENKHIIFEKTTFIKSLLVFIMIVISFFTIISIPTIEYAGASELVVTLFIAFFYILYFSIIFAKKVPLLFKLVIVGVMIFHASTFINKMPIKDALFNDSTLLLGFIIGLISLTIMIICFKSMAKRTPYGNEILGKIKGFRNFLEAVEKPKLEELVMQNPSYFYNILPFTYVLGVSNKWIKKFENINMQVPNWYSGSTAFNMSHFGSFMDSTMSSASRSMSSSPSSSGGGGSSGGGSSGGGSGGGGGGSW